MARTVLTFLYSPQGKGRCSPQETAAECCQPKRKHLQNKMNAINDSSWEVS